MTRLILLILLSTIFHLQQLGAQEVDPIETFLSQPPDKCSESNGAGFYDVFFPHESDCGKFYQCGKGRIMSEFECPGGTMWNQEAKHCDWARNVRCYSELVFYG